MKITDYSNESLPEFRARADAAVKALMAALPENFGEAMTTICLALIAICDGVEMPVETFVSQLAKLSAIHDKAKALNSAATSDAKKEDDTCQN